MKHPSIILAAVFAITAQLCPAQEAVQIAPTSTAIANLVAPIDATPGAPAAVVTTTQTPPAPRHAFERWVNLDELSFSFRYRSEKNNDDYRYFDNGQQKSLVVGNFKFDAAGSYAVHFNVSSGRTFNWSYADEIGDDYHKIGSGPAAFAVLTPAQLQAILSAIAADPSGYEQAIHIYSRGWEMSFRQLYFRATPLKQLEGEYGSLAIEKGVSTEATTYDEDGYIAGERVRLYDPKHLFFDQIAITYAYEGDILQPSFFSRGERLAQSNYHQFLAAKKFSTRLNTSADYTFDQKTHTLRQAAFIKVPETKVVDSVRLELYQRLNDVILGGAVYHAHQGFAVTGTKTFARRFHLDGGYAHIDYDYGVLTGNRILATVGFSMNGDSYLVGSRAFTHATWDVAPGVKLFGYYTHATADVPPDLIMINKEGVNGGMTLDLKTMLTKARVF